MVYLKCQTPGNGFNGSKYIKKITSNNASFTRYLPFYIFYKNIHISAVFQPITLTGFQQTSKYVEIEEAYSRKIGQILKKLKPL